MTVYAGSRYQNQTVYFLADPENSSVATPTVYGPTPNPNPAWVWVQVPFGIGLVDLALEYLGNQQLWWQIADLNPEIFYPGGILPVGAVVRVPTQSLTSSIVDTTAVSTT